MTHKTEKILAQIAQDPTKSRLIEIGVSVESLEKEKRELKAIAHKEKAPIKGLSSY